MDEIHYYLIAALVAVMFIMFISAGSPMALAIGLKIYATGCLLFLVALALGAVIAYIGGTLDLPKGKQESSISKQEKQKHPK